MQSIVRIVNALENTLERPKTIYFLVTVFVKMTLTMSNAALTALIVAHHTVLTTIALNVIAKVFLITKFHSIKTFLI